MNVTLRKPTIEDTAELYAVIDANRSHLSNLVWSAAATRLSTEKFLATVPEDENLNLVLVDGKIAGMITIRGEDEGQIGYWLADDHRHHGVMTTAVKMILDAHNDDYSVVSARIREQNLASQHILEACGFVDEFADYDGVDHWKIYIHYKRNV